MGTRGLEFVVNSRWFDRENVVGFYAKVLSILVYCISQGLLNYSNKNCKNQSKKLPDEINYICGFYVA